MTFKGQKEGLTEIKLFSNYSLTIELHELSRDYCF